MSNYENRLREGFFGNLGRGIQRGMNSYLNMASNGEWGRRQRQNTRDYYSNRNGAGVHTEDLYQRNVQMGAINQAYRTINQFVKSKIGELQASQSKTQDDSSEETPLDIEPSKKGTGTQGSNKQPESLLFRTILGVSLRENGNNEQIAREIVKKANNGSNGGNHNTFISKYDLDQIVANRDNNLFFSILAGNDQDKPAVSKSEGQNNVNDIPETIKDECWDAVQNMCSSLQRNVIYAQEKANKVMSLVIDAIKKKSQIDWDSFYNTLTA